jgi:predicted CoA-binding protein
MKATKSQIEEFINLNSFAIIGVSAKKKKFGNEIMKQMLQRGYDIYPVHRTAPAVDGIKCYPNLISLPEKPEGVIACVHPEQTEKVVLEMTNAGIAHIWMQNGSSSAAAVNYCISRGIKVVNGECLIMFLNNLGFPHGLHKKLWNFVNRSRA